MLTLPRFIFARKLTLFNREISPELKVLFAKHSPRKFPHIRHTYDSAVSIFRDSGVCITVEGKRHLGAALGTPSFIASFVNEKVSLWKKELALLSDISVTQPHAAYAAFVHGVVSKWNYLVRCIPDLCDSLLPLEEIICTKFLPNLTGQCSFSDLERDLLSLPPRLGGLGVINPATYSSFQFSSSVSITAPLVELIVQQTPIYSAAVLGF